MQSALPIELQPVGGVYGLPRTLAGKAALTLAATGLMALAAHVSVPLYFTPVPLTLQTFAVILIGLTLGPGLGASAMLLYLAEGATGLPVFSPHGPGGIAQLFGATAGYLFAYPFAAAAAGAVVRMVRSHRAHFPAAVLAGALATTLILTVGAGWLAHLLKLSPHATWGLAVAPFLPGELLKIAAAAAMYSALRRRVR